MTESRETRLYWILKFGLLASFGILLTATLRLSLIRWKYYQSIAWGNKVYENVIPAARGAIFDRKGRMVAESVYQYFKKEGENKIYEGTGEFDGYKFEGKDLAYELKRRYLYKESLGMVTGYVGSVNEKELKAEKCGTFLSNWDVVGRGGVEEGIDCDLRGVDGKRLIEVDAKGDYVRELGRLAPEKGKDINLSLDAYWQEKIYKLLEGKKAVVVISEPKTGKILTMVSSPSFDPNAFSYDQNKEMIQNYLDDKANLPLLNRAVAGRYHPGSVFKITVATAGLQTGVIDRNTLFEDTGVIKVGDYSYTNWLWTKRGGTDGMVDIVAALKRSNDIYFYRLGERVGPANMKIWAEKFGLGNKTGVELPGEAIGVIPDEKWKQEARGEKWYLGNTYHMAIGQGDVDVTPLQINEMTNVIANGGVKCEMSLLRDKKPECESLGIKKETINIVTEGMKAACKTGGTAWPLFNFKTELACKTGTAEVGDGSKDTHAWLTAFAPALDPQISITVLVERGGEGSDVAAPIVGDILKEWFDEPKTVVPRYEKK